MKSKTLLFSRNIHIIRVEQYARSNTLELKLSAEIISKFICIDVDTI